MAVGNRVAIRAWPEVGTCSAALVKESLGKLGKGTVGSGWGPGRTAKV